MRTTVEPVTAETSLAPEPVSEPASESGLERFGHYHLVRKLAHGAIADLYLAKQVGPEGFERDLVVKRLRAELSEDAAFVSMFLDEARIAARLWHHNVIQIHDLGHADGHYYLCMEYLPGEDLAAVLRAATRAGKPVPLPIVTRIFLDAAAGLHFAHEFTDASGQPMNVIHRDVSPSNIFVTYEGHVKLLDFGIAKAESRLSSTRVGTVNGKFEYMAPEQAQGADADRRADVFALGTNLYEALTGTRPFTRDSMMAIAAALTQGDFATPRSLRPELPAAIERVVLRAMTVDPEERYQTARAFAEELAAAVGGRAATSHELARYVRGLFGPERVAFKTQIPSVSTLHVAREAFASVPAFAPGALLRTPPTGETLSAPLPPRRELVRRALIFGGASLVGALLLAGWILAFFVDRTPSTVAPPPAVLVVSADPAGAQVAIDGQERGAAPLTVLGLPPGEHLITAEAAGHARVEQRISVGGPGERTNVVLALPPIAPSPPPASQPQLASATVPLQAPARRRLARGTLSLQTDPVTRVYLGKRLLGQTPLANVSLPAGTHVLRLVNEQKKLERRVELTIRANQATKKSLKL